MNGFILVIPLFLIRFGLLGMENVDLNAPLTGHRLNRAALSRAAHFAPLEGREKAAYVFYQVSNVFLILYPLFLNVQARRPLFYIGMAVYILGIAVLMISTVEFAKPDEIGLNDSGIYGISRNPMYVGYFLYFAGCAVLMRSGLFFVSLLVFQISAHWIILSEERWCIGQFGENYVSYMKRVRRYF